MTVVVVVAPTLGLLSMGQVPSAPGDPVLEPYVLVAAAFVAGLVGHPVEGSRR